MRHPKIFLFLSGLGLAACGSTEVSFSPGVSGEAVCAGGIHGKRYTLCGKLTSTGLGPAGASGQRVAGSFDATHVPLVDRYALRGGSFHVER